MSEQTIMTKESNFKLTEEQMVKLVGEATHLLKEYEYDVTDEALRKIFAKWENKKGWLVDLFRKDARYNGNGQIVIPASLTRPVNREDINKFVKWATKEYTNILAKREIKIGFFTLDEYTDMRRDVYHIYDSLSRGDTHNGRTAEEWKAELRRIDDRISKELQGRSTWLIQLESRTAQIYRDDYDSLVRFNDILAQALRRCTEREIPNILDKESVEYINEKAERMGIETRAMLGQRVNKFIGKLLKELGMNHITDIKTVTWTDPNTGELRTREKDYGYNYWYAFLGDAINPVTYTKEVVISVNPIDYWTMSFGYKWASCHTIDKKNKREVSSSNYQGCYSGGTESYMLDDSSFIVYVRPSAEELASIGESELPMEMQSKFKRVVFMMGEDKLVESRLYPDGRDGGDESIAGQMRNIVQKVVTDLYETPNMWTLKTGTSACREATNTDYNSPHYRDYLEYSDCNVSYLRRINGNMNYNKINVGSTIICPSCGDTHSEQEHITCYDCFYGSTKCDSCGRSIRHDDCERIEINENNYCCVDCAYDDGWEDTYDCGWQRRDDCREDAYTGEWYYEWENIGIETEDGNWYRSSDHAERDGYVYADFDGGWYLHNDVKCLADGQDFYLPDHDEAVETPDGWYLSAEDAEADGWVLDENGNYVAA